MFSFNVTAITNRFILDKQFRTINITYLSKFVVNLNIIVKTQIYIFYFYFLFSRVDFSQLSGKWYFALVLVFSVNALTWLKFWYDYFVLRRQAKPGPKPFRVVQSGNFQTCLLSFYVKLALKILCTHQLVTMHQITTIC